MPTPKTRIGVVPTFTPGPVGEEKGPCEYRLYLRSYGYSDEAITGVFEKIDQGTENRRMERSREEINRREAESERERIRAISLAPRIDPTKQTEDRGANPLPQSDRPVGAILERKQGGEPKRVKAPKLSLPSETLTNGYGIEVTRTGSGRCTVFGESTSSMFRWAGSKGWSLEDCQRLIANLNLEGVSVSSVGILLKAGARDFRVPELTKDQEKKLSAAKGK